MTEYRSEKSEVCLTPSRSSISIENSYLNNLLANSSRYARLRIFQSTRPNVSIVSSLNGSHRYSTMRPPRSWGPGGCWRTCCGPANCVLSRGRTRPARVCAASRSGISVSHPPGPSSRRSSTTTSPQDRSLVISATSNFPEECF